MKNLLFLFIFILSFQNAYAHKKQEGIPFFISPKNWEVVNLKKYPKYVKISFIKKEKSLCRPTLNLAQEKTLSSLQDYVNAAKKAHESDSNITYTILGNIDLNQGKAILCQIDKKIALFKFQMLQMIFIKDNTAYVMTAGCKKSQMSENRQTFMKSFLSFKVLPDLFSLVENNKELIEKYQCLTNPKKRYNKKIKKQKLIVFEKYLEKKIDNLGKYFQILFIQKAYSQMREVK